jgi:hypothetical protein
MFGVRFLSPRLGTSKIGLTDPLTRQSKEWIDDKGT